MKKTPAIIWIISAVLMLNSAQAVFVAIGHEKILFQNYAWAAGSLIAAVGLILNKKWSQYLVYIFASVTSILWLCLIWLTNSIGCPDEDIITTMISLIPGGLLLIVCIGSCVVVYKHFNKSQKP